MSLKKPEKFVIIFIFFLNFLSIGVFQEKMRSEEYKTTEHNMMYNMNLYGCLILSVMILFTGEIWGFLDFAMKSVQECLICNAWRQN